MKSLKKALANLVCAMLFNLFHRSCFCLTKLTFSQIFMGSDYIVAFATFYSQTMERLTEIIEMAFSNTIYLNLLLSFYGSCFWVTKSNLSWIVMGNVPLFFLGFMKLDFIMIATLAQASSNWGVPFYTAQLFADASFYTYFEEIPADAVFHQMRFSIHFNHINFQQPL